MSNIKLNGIKLSKLLQDKKGGRVKEGRGVRVRKEDHSCAMAELSLRNLLNLYGKLLRELLDTQAWLSGERILESSAYRQYLSSRILLRPS